MKEFSRTLSQAQGRVPSSSILLKPKVCPLAFFVCFCFVSLQSILPSNKRLATLLIMCLKPYRSNKAIHCECCDSLDSGHGFAFSPTINNSLQKWLNSFLCLYIARRFHCLWYRDNICLHWHKRTLDCYAVALLLHCRKSEHVKLIFSPN